MISPHTPPGTKIVCINDDPGACHVLGRKYSDRGLDGLKADNTYTVADIFPCDACKSGFVVVVHEITRRPCRHGHADGFDISRFRRLELPKSITDFLTAAPVDLAPADSDHLVTTAQ